MRSSIQSYFSPADRDAIAAATAAAEQRTEGELVCFVVERCDDYPEARLRLVLLGAIFSVCAVALWHAKSAMWGSPDLAWVVTALGVGALVGFALSFVEPLARIAIGKRRLEHHAGIRAQTAYLEEEVFDTATRTGVLIFVALFEHQVIIRSDEGIHGFVDPDAWDGVVARLVAKLRAGEPARALVDAIDECATIIEQHADAAGEASATDADEHEHSDDCDHDHGNELPDEPRLRKR